MEFLGSAVAIIFSIWLIVSAMIVFAPDISANRWVEMGRKGLYSLVVLIGLAVLFAAFYGILYYTRR
jgi:hypothetical protein